MRVIAPQPGHQWQTRQSLDEGIPASPDILSRVDEPLVTRMRAFGTTVFAEMTALAVRTGSINLGQGFPDTDGPAARRW
jgi:hypothetical protein